MSSKPRSHIGKSITAERHAEIFGPKKTSDGEIYTRASGENWQETVDRGFEAVEGLSPSE